MSNRKSRWKPFAGGVVVTALNKAGLFVYRHRWFIILGLCFLTASAGLFLRYDISLFLSIAYPAFLALFAFLLLRRAFATSGGSIERFMAALTGVLIINFSVQLTGGLKSPFMPAYFILVASASFWPRKLIVTGGLLTSILLLEGSNLLLLHRFAPPVEAMNIFLGYALSLSLVAFLVGLLSRTQVRWAEKMKEENERLHSSARSLGSLQGDESEDLSWILSRDGRQIHWIGAARELDQKLSAILELTAEALEADNCGVFLLEGKGEELVLRRVHPYREVSPMIKVAVSERLIGAVARTGTPVILGSLRPGDHRITYLGRRHQVRSFAASPVIYQQVVIGVLFADSTRPDAFADRKSLMAGFASQVAEAVWTSKNAARKEEEGRKREALRLISHDLSSSLKKEEIIRTLLDRTAEMIGFRMGAFFLKEDDERMVLKAVFGLPEDSIGKAFNMKRSFIGRFVSQRRSLLFDDLDYRKKRFRIIPGLEYNCRSLMTVPVALEEDMVGIFLAGDPEPERFDYVHLSAIEVLANQVAILLANASLHEKVEQMAITDGLTGLFNHRHFHERLGQEVIRVRRHPEPISLIILDIDHFKKINDNYGHPFGDVVLKGIAGLLSSLAREVDIVARYGGEEMAVLMINTDQKGAQAMAKRIMQGIRLRKFEHPDGEISVTVSLGSATHPDDGKTPADLIRAADVALYHSKNNGRNRYTPAYSLHSRAAR